VYFGQPYGNGKRVVVGGLPLGESNARDTHPVVGHHRAAEVATGSGVVGEREVRASTVVERLHVGPGGRVVRPDVVEDVVHDTVEERDVGAGTDADVHISLQRGAGLAGVHDDELGGLAASARGVDVRHARGMVLSRVRTHDEHAG
jgi:hypothetical protein